MTDHSNFTLHRAGERPCRHCNGTDPHCSVCEGVGSLPNVTAEPVQKLHELPEDELKAAFLKGWDACWCRKPDAPFERDGGRQTAWEKYRGTIEGGAA